MTATGSIKEFDAMLMISIMDYIKVFEDGHLQIRFYGMTECEYEMK